MKDAQSILFDLDGTLTDSAPGIINTLIHTAEKLGIALPADKNMMDYVGPPLRENLLQLAGPERLDEAVAIYQERYVTQKKGVMENGIYDGVIAMLEAVAATGKPLFVATSKYIVPTLQITERFGLDRFFKKIYGSLEGGRYANKAELLELIVKEEGLDPARTIMIGDRRHDVIGAKKNGVSCIGVLWGYGSAQELEEAGAIQLAQTPQALTGLLV